MRIALVVPPWGPDDIRAKDTRGISGCWPTPGLQYIAAVLRDAGHEILFLEGFFYSNDEMLKKTVDFGAQALGVYVISLLWDKAKPFIEEVRESIPSIFTFIGGHGATAMPEVLMKETSALDAIVIGEGEITSRELIEAVESGGDLRQVKGLLLRDDGGLYRTPPREIIDSLDELPFPAVDLCEMDRYYPSFEQVSTVPAMQMLSSRGCSGSCLYCYKMYGSRIRLRDPVLVVDEIECYINNYGTKEIKFWDEHFSADHNHVYGICDEILRRGLKIRWWVSCRADSVDRPLLTAMKKAGCWCINYGVESGLQKHLDTLLKYETLDQIRSAIKLTHSVGIKTHTTYIFGIPGETFEDGLKTIEFAKELGSFTVEFFPITPFPGTPLYKGVLKGIFGTMSEKLADQGMLLDRPCFVPFTMTAEEIMELRRLAYIKYFFPTKVPFLQVEKYHVTLPGKGDVSWSDESPVDGWRADFCVMEKNNKSISVVIPVHNSEKTLEAVLKALREELRAGDQLIVVDDRSDDSSREIALLFGAEVVSSSGRPGAAGARNTGAEGATGEWVLFVDSDAVAPAGWRDKLQQRIDQRPAAVQATYSPVAAGNHPATFYKNFYYYYTFTKRISSDFITGCGTFFFAVARTAFLELKGFDDRIPGATVEDADFAARLVGGGGRILMAPEIEVYHLREYTFSELMRYEWTMMKSKILYVLRRSRDHAVPSVSMATPREMLPVLAGAVSVWFIPAGLAAYAAGWLWGIWLAAAGFSILAAGHARFWFACVREAGIRGFVASFMTLPDLVLVVPAILTGVMMHLTGRKFG